MELNISLEACANPGNPGSTPEHQLAMDDKEILESLQAYLQAPVSLEPTLTPRVLELVARLKVHLHLSEEERMVLRLRYRDGIRMQAIVKLLNLKGDPYKRHNAIIRKVRAACQKAGMLS